MHLNSKLTKSELKLCGFQVSFSICPSSQTRELYTEICMHARNQEQGNSEILCWKLWWCGLPSHHRLLEMERTRKRPGENLIQFHHITNEKVKARESNPSKVTGLFRSQPRADPYVLAAVGCPYLDLFGPLFGSKVREPCNLKQKQKTWRQWQVSVHYLIWKSISTYFQRDNIN